MMCGTRKVASRRTTIENEFMMLFCFFFFFQAEKGIRDRTVTGVQTCALPFPSQNPRKKKKLCKSGTSVQKKKEEKKEKEKRKKKKKITGAAVTLKKKKNVLETHIIPVIISTHQPLSLMPVQSNILT